MMDRAWILQHRIEKRLHRIPVLSFERYFFACTLIFLLMGFMLFFYCILLNINIINVTYSTGPLFYLILGIVCFFCYIAQRRSSFFS